MKKLKNSVSKMTYLHLEEASLLIAFCLLNSSEFVKPGLYADQRIIRFGLS